jgi:very-short-patch-repair endonuclease
MDTRSEHKYSSRKQKAYNQKKELYLTKQGYKVMHIRGRSITQRMLYVLERFKTTLDRANR